MANPLLSPLGDYGGPTQTIALLPGSPAIGTGTAVSGVSTDQRGEPLDSPVPDIGAFQSQGFKLTPVAGSTPQSATVSTAFANPLAATVTANNPLEPVAGGVITFVAPSSGASATLSGTAAMIGSNGIASTTATANSTTGSYAVTATASGVATSASFNLTNTNGGPTNVTGELSVKYSGFTYNPKPRLSSQAVTITNIGNAPINGPIELVLLNLTNATLLNQSGTYEGNPYITILSGGSLGVGQSLTVTLLFSDPSRAAITYTAEFLAGPIPTATDADWLPHRGQNISLDRTAAHRRRSGRGDTPRIVLVPVSGTIGTPSSRQSGFPISC